MRAREFVHETFNQPYSFNWQGNDAQALIGRGEYLNIDFSRGIPGQYFLDFDVNGRKLVTGRGDAYRIFATVLAAIKEFVEKQDVKELQFNAKNDEEEGDSRTNLYDRLVKRYATSAGYNVTTKESGTYKTYKLLRKDLDLEGEDRWFREDVENYGGIDFDIEIERDEEDEIDNIYVKALANGRELGHVLFTISYDSEGMVLNPQDLEVDERYRGQGIASTMYDYMQSKGYRIRRSGQQTDAGAGLWDKYKPGKNIWEQGVAEGSAGYKEIEFICVNPEYPDATDPKLQKQMYLGLKKIPNVIPLLQDWDEYSEGQKSLSAIYKDKESRQKILALAKQLGVEIDLERPVSDDYIDRAIRGEHEGQQGVTENFADGKVKGKSRPGRVKRSGASCSGSVSSLRAKAKKYSGERSKMYHWCANMKSGRNKK